MRKIEHIEKGITVYNDGLILLVRCPRCDRENWAPEVAFGNCAFTAISC